MLLALLFGILAYRLVSKVIDKFSSWLWDMKKLDETDEFFVENGATDSNVIVSYKMKRVPYEQIKSFARD